LPFLWLLIFKQTYFNHSKQHIQSMEAPSSIPSVLEKLTRQEGKVLQLVADGLSSQEIATQLNISVLTVKTHRQHITHKADIKGALAIRKFIRDAIPFLKNTTFILLLYYLSSIVAMF
jgi:DNA-binding NarL/FixJ family response regulator